MATLLPSSPSGSLGSWPSGEPLKTKAFSIAGSLIPTIPIRIQDGILGLVGGRDSRKRVRRQRALKYFQSLDGPRPTADNWILNEDQSPRKDVAWTQVGYHVVDSVRFKYRIPATPLPIPATSAADVHTDATYIPPREGIVAEFHERPRTIQHRFAYNEPCCHPYPQKTGVLEPVKEDDPLAFPKFTGMCTRIGADGKYKQPWQIHHYGKFYVPTEAIPKARLPSEVDWKFPERETSLKPRFEDAEKGQAALQTFSAPNAPDTPLCSRPPPPYTPVTPAPKKQTTASNETRPLYHTLLPSHDFHHTSCSYSAALTTLRREPFARVTSYDDVTLDNKEKEEVADGGNVQLRKKKEVIYRKKDPHENWNPLWHSGRPLDEREKRTIKYARKLARTENKLVQLAKNHFKHGRIQKTSQVLLDLYDAIVYVDFPYGGITATIHKNTYQDMLAYQNQSSHSSLLEFGEGHVVKHHHAPLNSATELTRTTPFQREETAVLMAYGIELGKGELYNYEFLKDLVRKTKIRRLNELFRDTGLRPGAAAYNGFPAVSAAKCAKAVQRVKDERTAKEFKNLATKLSGVLEKYGHNLSSVAQPSVKNGRFEASQIQTYNSVFRNGIFEEPKTAADSHVISEPKGIDTTIRPERQQAISWAPGCKDPERKQLRSVLEGPSGDSDAGANTTPAVGVKSSGSAVKGDVAVEKKVEQHPRRVSFAADCLPPKKNSKSPVKFNATITDEEPAPPHEYTDAQTPVEKGAHLPRRPQATKQISKDRPLYSFEAGYETPEDDYSDLVFGGAVRDKPRHEGEKKTTACRVSFAEEVIIETIKDNENDNPKLNPRSRIGSKGSVVRRPSSGRRVKVAVNKSGTRKPSGGVTMTRERKRGPASKARIEVEHAAPAKISAAAESGKTEAAAPAVQAPSLTPADNDTRDSAVADSSDEETDIGKILLQNRSRTSTRSMSSPSGA
ncbi:hypothetical protein BJ878DRAFT_547475 [Calycina marina]|uniref:Uncharacterized protein n=1 Tax=Calycina marina TaxID=1763456 RepID=A0A9P8CFX2_9HELO|nr:hypothetical protein BJ878DRAFT_547475 [Calycina marina]